VRRPNASADEACTVARAIIQAAEQCRIGSHTNCGNQLVGGWVQCAQATANLYAKDGLPQVQSSMRKCVSHHAAHATDAKSSITDAGGGHGVVKGERGTHAIGVGERQNSHSSIGGRVGLESRADHVISQSTTARPRNRVRSAIFEARQSTEASWASHGATDVADTVTGSDTSEPTTEPREFLMYTVAGDPGSVATTRSAMSFAVAGQGSGDQRKHR